MRNSVEKKFKHSKNYSSCILRFVHTVYSVVPRPLSRDFRVTWKKNQPIHRWATGVLPPQTNDLFTTVHPHTGWPPEVAPEAAEKVTIFVQNCQNFAAFRRLSRKFSSFVFYSPPGLGLQKPLPPPAEIWLIPLPVADPPPTYVPTPRYLMKYGTKKYSSKELYKPAGVELLSRDEDDMVLHQGNVRIMELEKILCVWRRENKLQTAMAAITASAILILTCGACRDVKRRRPSC